jgi:penicillin-binding protein 2
LYLLHRPEDLPPGLSSRLTVRAAVFSVLVIALVSTIFLRLWYLQVLSGDDYRARADNNRIREIRTQAPRGRIVDRDGTVLVANRPVVKVELRADQLPSDRGERRRELAELARLTGQSTERLREKISETASHTGYPAVIRQNLGRNRLFYLLEHQDRFPGVSIGRSYTRKYDQGTLAAHLLGMAGQVSPAQLEQPAYRDLEPGDIVGQAGLEKAYDRFLRGRAGEQRIQVDALGRPKGQLASGEARAGSSLRLALEADLQATGETALRASGLPSAFVAMNVHTGAVLAMGSHPSFDPAFYAKPHTQAEYTALEEQTDSPLLNRATQGGYPTGSSFKPITATAGLEEGLVSPEEIVVDGGSLSVGGQVFSNAGGAVHGSITMSDALKVSSDVYFYRLGLEAETNGSHGQIQDWAHRYGLGRRTGIDLSAEAPGLVPTPAWRNRLFRRESNPLIDRPWGVGDNINLSIGQGDLQVTPLQLANAYAALANGGTVVTPHLGSEIVDTSGQTVKEIDPAPRRKLEISPVTREAILEGLHRAATEPGGTSASVFGDFPVPVAGKTGTAERGAGNADQSWYAALAPYPDPQIVVVATVERGGFGVEAAAPLAAQILERHFELTQDAE